MIRYALVCAMCDHEFDAWFASSAAYDDLSSRQLVQCAECASHQVSKQIMAPQVRSTRKDCAGPDPRKLAAEFAKKARDTIASDFDYVGDRFAHEARAMHYGEADHRPIWGETSAEDQKALKEEGVAASPLPDAFVPKRVKPPEELN